MKILHLRNQLPKALPIHTVQTRLPTKQWMETQMVSLILLLPLTQTMTKKHDGKLIWVISQRSVSSLCTIVSTAVKNVSLISKCNCSTMHTLLVGKCPKDQPCRIDMILHFQRRLLPVMYEYSCWGRITFP